MEVVIRYVTERDLVNMVATHADWTGNGVGRALLDEGAGFVIEGTMPRRGFGAGGWMDAHLMGGCTTAEPAAPAHRILGRAVH